MFGNVIGWIISAAIAGLVAVLIFMAGRVEGISSPTGRLKAAMNPVALPVDPATLGIKPGTEDADAGDHYRAAVQIVKGAWAKHERYKKFVTEAVKDQPEAVQLVVRGAKCNKSNIFVRSPSDIIHYKKEEDLDSLLTAGTLANNMALYHLRKDEKARAKELAEATFLLGQRLFEERLTFKEFYTGTDLMTSASHTLGEIAKAENDAARDEVLNKFEKDVGDFQKTKMQDIYQVIVALPVQKKEIAAPGDIFLVAQESPEPMWQTEALMKLGRMRFMTGVKRGDQLGATRITKQIADRTDLKPGPKAAAIAARDLTPEVFRMYGN